MSKPLCIDLFCGLGGWTEGFLGEGYDVVGFDIERHVYGDQKYPAQLVLQDVLTLHGSQFKNAAVIVASPPCQAYYSDPQGHTGAIYEADGWAKFGMTTNKTGYGWKSRPNRKDDPVTPKQRWVRSP